MAPPILNAVPPCYSYYLNLKEKLPFYLYIQEMPMVRLSVFDICYGRVEFSKTRR